MSIDYIFKLLLHSVRFNLLCIVSHYFWLPFLYENIHSKWSFVSEKVSTSRMFCVKSNKHNQKYWVHFSGMHSLHPYILLSVFEIWRFVWIHLWRWYMHTASKRAGESVSKSEREVIMLKLQVKIKNKSNNVDEMRFFPSSLTLLLFS